MKAKGHHFFRQFRLYGRTLFLFLLCFPDTSFAHIRQIFMDTSGKTRQVRWTTNSLPGNFAYNPAGLPAVDFAVGINASFTQWESALSGTGLNLFGVLTNDSPLAEFDVSSGGCGIPDGFPNGWNSLLFSTQVADPCRKQELSSSIVGLTTSWFSLSSGKIIEADVQFNDDDFVFLAGDNVPATATEINLKDVLTHELGHVIGADHSQSIRSTMFPTATNGQRELSDDDRALVRAIYAPSFAGVGSIRGTVWSNTTALFGVHVTAVQLDANDDASTPPFVASTVTGLNGEFYLPGLPTGVYSIFIDSFKLAAYLGSYYRDVAGDGINGPANQLYKAIQNLGVVKGFAANANQEPLLVWVKSQTEASWVNLQAGALLDSEEAQEASGNNTVGQAASLTPVSGAGYRTVGRLTNDDYYKVTLAAGQTTLYARVMGHMLYSSLDPGISVTNPGAGTCAARDDIDLNVTNGTQMRDADVFCTGLTAGATYYVRLSQQAVVNCSDSEFPLGNTAALCSPASSRYVFALGPTDGGVPAVPEIETLTDTLASDAPVGFDQCLGRIQDGTSLDSSCGTPETTSCLACAAPAARVGGGAGGGDFLSELLLLAISMGLYRWWRRYAHYRPHS